MSRQRRSRWSFRGSDDLSYFDDLCPTAWLGPVFFIRVVASPTRQLFAHVSSGGVLHTPLPHASSPQSTDSAVAHCLPWSVFLTVVVSAVLTRDHPDIAGHLVAFAKPGGVA